jgi:hypothetical protein
MPGNRARPVRRGALGKGPAPAGTSSAAYPTSRTDLWGPGGESPPGYPTFVFTRVCAGSGVSVGLLACVCVQAVELVRVDAVHGPRRE